MEIYSGIELENFVREQFYDKKSEKCFDKPTISEYKAELIKQRDLEGDKLNRLETGISIFEEYGIEFNRAEAEKKIGYLKENYMFADERVMEFERLLAEKQNKCEHDWYNVGHDSHYDFYKCPLCGASDKC